MPRPQRNQKPRRSKVNRQPYWVPWGGPNDEGEWTYLPVDRAHNMQVVALDDDGEETGAASVYEDKGYVPLRFASEEMLAKLPINWKQMLLEAVQPEYPDAKKSSAASKSEAMA